MIVAEFAYEWTVDGERSRVPCFFVVRVRDGLIVESRDYVDHLGAARVRGRLPEMPAALGGPADRDSM